MPLYRQPIQQAILDALGVRVTNTEDLLTTVQSSVSSLESRISALESNLDHPGYISGRYYQGLENAHTDSSSSGALTTSTITYVPFQIHDDIHISRLAIYCSANSSEANARIGIYSNLNGMPEDLVVDAGNLIAATPGVKEGVISTNLNKNWYWFGGISSKSPFLYCATAFLGNNHILGQLSPTSINVNYVLRNTGTYTSLPSKAPKDNLSLVSGNIAPMFWFKVD